VRGWIAAVGARTAYIEPGSPWENGYCESFNARFRDELLRRTFATVAMEAGILEEVVGRLLNHTPLSITGQRNARPSLDALRPAMQVACCELEQRTGKARS
jgi:transposase InsO family protein